MKNNVCLPKNYSVCDKNTYYNENNKKCENCDIGCIECEYFNLDSCLKCSKRRPYLQDGICINKCSEGYFIESKSNENERCFKCDSNCYSCVNHSRNCTSCKNGFKLNEKNECKQILLNGNKF